MLRSAYRRLPVTFRRRVRLARLLIERRRSADRAELHAHSLRGDIAKGTVRVRRMGLDLQLDLADGASRVAYFTGGVERPLVELLRQELRPGDVVADIGAHVGFTALSAAKVLVGLGGGGVVHAFEGSPDTAARLRRHVAMNQLEDEVNVVEVVLWDRVGRATLRADAYFGRTDPSTRTLYGDGVEVAEAVPAITFDSWADLVALGRLDVVKLDVEGAEVAVLDGMREALCRFRPRLVLVEEKDYIFERAGVSRDAVQRRLEGLGYLRFGSVRSCVPLIATEHDECNIVYRLGAAPT